MSFVRRIARRFRRAQNKEISAPVFVAFSPRECFASDCARLMIDVQSKTKEKRASTLNQMYEARKRLRQPDEKELSKERRQAIGNAQTLLKALQGQLNALNAQLAREESQSKETHRRLFDQLLKIPRVTKAYIDVDRITVVTDELFGKLTESPHTWHRLGRREVSNSFLEPSETSLTWSNISHSDSLLAVLFGEMVAPQIPSNGKVSCFGTAKTPVVTACVQRDFVALFKVAVRLIECPGDVSDSHSKNSVLKRWPIVSDEAVPSWYLEEFGPTGEPYK